MPKKKPHKWFTNAVAGQPQREKKRIQNAHEQKRGEWDWSFILHNRVLSGCPAVFEWIEQGHMGHPCISHTHKHTMCFPLKQCHLVLFSCWCKWPDSKVTIASEPLTGAHWSALHDKLLLKRSPVGSDQHSSWSSYLQCPSRWLWEAHRQSMRATGLILPVASNKLVIGTIVLHEKSL